MVKRLLQLLLGLAVATFFIWLSLREVALRQVFDELGKIGYMWVIPYVIMVTLSNFARAERWKMVLDDESGTKNKRFPLFAGLMYGYSGNLAIPRAGEFIRALFVAKSTGLETTKLFGTIVLERVIDVAIMLLMLLVTFLLLITDDTVLNQIFGKDGTSYILAITSNAGLVIIAAGFLAALGLLYYLKKVRKSTSDLQAESINAEKLNSTQSIETEKVNTDVDSAENQNLSSVPGETANSTNGNKLRELLKNFIRGLISLRRLKNWPLFIFYTLFIWFGYVAMTLIPFYAFDLHIIYGFGWEQAFVITVIGAIGVALPSPGGIGTYHYLVQQGLVVLYQVPAVVALSYATIGHFMNMVVLLATTLIVFLLNIIFQRRQKGENIPFSKVFR